MKIKKNIPKISIVLILSLALFLQNSFVAFALFGLGGTDPTDFFEEFEDRYHFDQQTLSETGDSFNSSGNKQLTPQIEVTFTPDDPDPGDELTALVTPEYFQTSPDNLYYTWYIKKGYTDLNGEVSTCDVPSSGHNSNPSSLELINCDADGNGEITVNDWKVEASRIMANGENSSEYTYGDPPADYTYDYDEDEDGYYAPLGGDGNQQSNYGGGNESAIDDGPFCYIHNFRNGENYRLVEDVSDFGGEVTCSLPGYTAVCGNHLTELDLADSEEDAEELVIDITGDMVNPGESLTLGGGITNPVNTDNLLPITSYCQGTSLDPLCVNNQVAVGPADLTVAEPYCPSGTTPICVPETRAAQVANGEEENYGASGCDECNDTAGVGDCCENMIDGTESGCENVTAPVCDGFSISLNSSDADYWCEHLFPIAYDEDRDIAFMGANDTGGGIGNEEGTFKGRMEDFWKTDPEDPDSSDDGKKDEESVVGLGYNSFTWTYHEGDEIGVAVEGKSMLSAPEENSSMMIMFAFSNNDCEVGDTTASTKNISGYPALIKLGEVPEDLDDDGVYFDRCFMDNLVDPTEGNQQENLDIELVQAPTNPINDSSDEGMGDVVSVQASIDDPDSQNENMVLYEWEVKMIENDYLPPERCWSDDADEREGCSTLGFDVETLCDEDGCDGDLDLDSGDVQTVGNGLSELEFKLGLQDVDGNFYLRVKSEVTQNFSDNYFETGARSSSGTGTVVFKVSDLAGNSIVVKEVSVNDTGLVSLAPAMICPRADAVPQVASNERRVCPVIKNQIVGLQAPSGYDGYAWTLNGESISCNSNISTEEQCSGSSQGYVNFFAATGDPGDIYTVKLVATNNNSEDGDSDFDPPLDLTRVFTVTDPKVKINFGEPPNNPCSVSMGSYEDVTDGSQVVDYSLSVFETTSGTEVDVSNAIGFTPSSIAPSPTNTQTIVSYYVNGLPGSSFTAGEGANGVAVSSHEVLVEASYRYDRSHRKALENIWGVSQFDSGEILLSDAATVNVSSTACGTAVRGVEKSKTLIGSLFSNLAGNFMFLFKIVITVMIMLITTNIVFSLTPRNYEED